MPTLLDYAGIAAAGVAEGRSLRPLVEGKTVPWRDFVVSEVNGFPSRAWFARPAISTLSSPRAKTASSSSTEERIPAN